MNEMKSRERCAPRVGRAWMLGAWLGAMALLGGSIAVAHEADGHPAKIHDGTCQDLGRVAFSLNGVGASVDLDDKPIATPAPVNSRSAYQVMTSETTIDGTLETILSGGHAVMLYDNDEDMQVIACGNVGGAMAGDMLITGLAEAGVPGHVGFALFQPEGDQTLVTLIVGHAMAPVSASSGIAEPDDAAAEEAQHEDEDADHEHEEEDGHDGAATPEA